MKVSDFDYKLPNELIAQNPIDKREYSKLLIMDRFTGEVKHDVFYNIIDYLSNEDVLVINNTKVVPSRIIGEKVDTKAKIEVLLLKNKGEFYECLVKPFRRVKQGTVLDFEGLFTGEVLEKKEEGICLLKFNYEGIFYDLLNKVGMMPLPPYIHEKLKDNSRYQTIYAKNLGSAAAPTAGFHFTEELLEKIKAKGIEILEVSLNIGLDTFRDVKVEELEDHKMHSETYAISKEVADRLNDVKKKGKRIIAVGTTTTRTLEANFTKYGQFKEACEDTNIFIYPGYQYKAIDSMITNFHLPKSTLIMMVSAFSKREYILSAYEEAIKNKYRFFSFGDAMFIK
ncbi:MAG TPA: tRNA preQ1(34) S-adenosylmethionine ribosyltransferase-isomerase QueA [Bacilli bacterium]|jgi:S-adenosylmethionine:tRNA ribosyltransferase-isomerase|nr:tRNA preQ1(34) S-adenosylmethionine ribosyltransferase-isomerase QueA [Bacilli bacterium]